MARVYLDYNATSLPRGVRKGSGGRLRCLRLPTPPRSMPRAGTPARSSKTRAAAVAFCGRGTRSAWFSRAAPRNRTRLALIAGTGTCRQSRCAVDVLLLSAVEHPAVRAGGRLRCSEIEEVGVDAIGVIDLAALDAALAKHNKVGRRAFVSVMAANNETGVLQPLRDGRGSRSRRWRRVPHRRRAGARQDSVRSCMQAAPISFRSPRISSVDRRASARLIARHRRYARARLDARRRAGARTPARHRKCCGDRGLRCSRNRSKPDARRRKARGSARCARSSKTAFAPIAHDAVIFGERAARLPNTTFFAAPGIAAEDALIIAFDLEGIAISAGSACSSGKSQPRAPCRRWASIRKSTKGAMRVSMGWDTSEADVTQFLRHLVEGLYVTQQTRRARGLIAHATPRRMKCLQFKKPSHASNRSTSISISTASRH